MDQRPEEQAAGWLNENVGRTLLIEKRESGDLDRVELQLERVSFREAQPRQRDDYTDGRALLLQGSGSIESAALPGGGYVVPLHGLNAVFPGYAGMSIRTDRAQYEFRVKK